MGGLTEIGEGGGKPGGGGDKAGEAACETRGGDVELVGGGGA